MNWAKHFLAFWGWYLCAGPLLRLLREPRELAVAYHTIGETRSKYAHINISLEAFKSHINYLKKRGYSFHAFSEAAKSSAGKRAYIYFDDGFRTVYESALPYLREEQIRATLFVTTEYIDDKSADEYLRWEDIKKMTDIFEIRSHGAHHVKLNKIGIDEAEREMRTSKETIERNLGISVGAFSYPKGRSSDELEALAHRVGYEITTADKRFNKVRPDPKDSSSVFKWKILL